ncbi:hypothetical protein-transmembrane prediction [Rhodopirellula baltica SH 1]|uniref:Uncharacterized protein n=2 Tax=Rhodopirellula baltica TaxID=265606 RepID=Q7UEP6_RHOBA|nr:hypothetical protein-transmembrane prediction [Rhodopirellula baltica SH 1]
MRIHPGWRMGWPLHYSNNPDNASSWPIGGQTNSEASPPLTPSDLQPDMRDWIRLATKRSIVVRGVICSSIVGTILIAINQGDVIWNGNLEIRHAAKIGLT